MKVVIIGGVAGGASAAARLRRQDEHAQIILIERGRYISFANCGLPYHIGGVIENRESLLVQRKEDMEARFALDVRLRHEAVSLDRERKEVHVRILDTGEVYTERYDTLLLSPGAEPVRPPLAGIDSSYIKTLRSMTDMDSIIESLHTRDVKHAAVIGAGFIGIELAENLRRRGIRVTVVEKLDQVLPIIDYDLASQVHRHLAEHQVKLILKTGVTGFSEGEDGVAVTLEDGRTVDADLVILSIGVRPETSLAVQSGLEIGITGGIKVNEFLQTSDPDIYAVGDAIEVRHVVHGREVCIPLAWPANRQGRIAADTITGSRKAYRGTLGTSILQVFDLTAASTGLNEKTLSSNGIPYQAVTVNRNQHAEYYPGAKPFTLKVLFSGSGEIYGAQAIGEDGVDKRIDVIASAIRGNLRVWELQELELAYAPPFNAAKDPVNIAGYAAENVLNGSVKAVRWFEADHFISEQGFIPLDVRTQEEHQSGSLPGSLNIPVDELRGRLDELEAGQNYLVYCQVGHRGYVACRILSQRGFSACNLDGGYAIWHPATS